MIALNMIIGPYYEVFLTPAIRSCLDLVDEIVIVDTAPEKNPNRNTLIEEIDFGNKKVTIIEMFRGEDKDFSFSAARELARENTESDWVLRLDADEILHEKDIETLKAVTKLPKVDAVEVAFFHFMIYPWLYQYIEPKTILFKRSKAKWTRGVHEGLEIRGNTYKLHEVKYFHYGYCRGQEEVFKRWQLYVDIDGKPDWYKGQDPNHILDDRIKVCHNFEGEHPIVVQDTLNSMFSDVTPFRVRQLPRFSMSDSYVGLVLLTYNDFELLPNCIGTLLDSLDYPTVLYCLDQNSTDGSYEYLKDIRDNYRNTMLKDMVVEQTKLLPLAKALNKGFTHLMSRQECDYLGWVHPDMTFYKNNWLSKLVRVLLNEKAGKVSAYNPRDTLSEDIRIYNGYEQCYLIKRGVLYQIGLFDEHFLGIGGREDWDLNNRIRQEGFRVVISTDSQVLHEGMQTRNRTDTTFEEQYNKEWYNRKWGTDEETVKEAF